MNINELQFVSHRDSIASEFVSQTANNSSLLSSRRAFDDSIENDLEDFKEQIQYKFIRSVANKIYTYPLGQQGFDLVNDQEEFSDLVDVQEYNLFSQAQQVKDGFKKQQFKIKNKKIGSKTANLLLQTLKSQRQRISNLRTTITQGLETKKNSKLGGMIYLNVDDQSHREYTQQDSQLEYNYKKKRLNTEPYQKPMGFIIKKK